MADHRKSFRPRRFVLGASFMLAASLLPALAEDAGLKNGAAALSAGKYDNAVRMLSSTINSDNVSAGEAAQALYLRGIAYRKLGQPSRAIADLGAAIFLGLPDQDRVKALVNRGLAYQAAGLSTQGDAEIAQARKSGGGSTVDQLVAEGGGAPPGVSSIAAFSTEVTPEAQGYGARAKAEPGPGFGATVSSEPLAPPPPATPTRTASASSQWTTTANAEGGEASGQSGSRVSRWFGSLTGSSEQPAEPASAPAASTPPPAAPAPAPAKPPPAPSSGWNAQTQSGDVATDAPSGQSRFGRWFSKTAEADQAAAPPPPAATGGRGGFQLQLATSRSEVEAQALWKKVSSANAQLAGKAPEIEKVDIGNFGTFYSLKVGPFPDKAESLKVCNALKRNGVDCSVVSPEAQ